MPEMVTERRKNLYIEDLLSGGTTIKEAKFRKENAIESFGDAQFSTPFHSPLF